MKKTSFSTFGILKESYAIIKPKFWAIVLDYTILFVSFFALNSLSDHDALVTAVIATLFSYMSAVFAISYAEHGRFSFDMLFQSLTFKRFALFFCAMLIALLAVIGGLILLVIPGIIALIQLRFLKYILVEKDLTPMEALHESARLVKGNFWAIFEFSLVCLILNLLGIACLIVGFFFTAPLTLIALLLLYRKLDVQAAVETREDVITVEAKTV